ncbi:PleD family two-component system response regulator [Chloroflexota bacterium]
MSKPLLAVIVEDSPTQARQIKANLARFNVESIIAPDGPDGLRAVDEHQPDLVVLDVNLPTMDGFQVCRRLKRDPRTANIPVIMLTMEDNSEATLEGLDAGADDYIPKDMFAAENLLSTLEALGLLQK